MNRQSLLHIIERLEGFISRLPETIQKPVLRELTPLKELFLQQRPPRFVLTGSNRFSIQELVATLFESPVAGESPDLLMELFRWQTVDLGGHGTISLLDARGAHGTKIADVEEELKKHPADIFLYLGDDSHGARLPAGELDNLSRFRAFNDGAGGTAKVIGLVLHEKTADTRSLPVEESPPRSRTSVRARLKSAFEENQGLREHLLQVFEIPLTSKVESKTAARAFMSLLARQLPNQARVEMIRIARDRSAQAEIAHSLVKSTTAICTAIGAQPIPLADLPILTTLQLTMVSGIMYVSGRERSLRAATEFITAMGVNVGAGMVFREGARALLKFFPGWGNVVCGMVAGAGTYAIGRSAIVYFVEGVSLKDARRTYLKSRTRRAQKEAAKLDETASSKSESAPTAKPVE